MIKNDQIILTAQYKKKQKKKLMGDAFTSTGSLSRKSSLYQIYGTCHTISIKQDKEQQLVNTAPLTQFTLDLS